MAVVVGMSGHLVVIVAEDDVDFPVYPDSHMVQTIQDGCKWHAGSGLFASLWADTISVTALKALTAVNSLECVRADAIIRAKMSFMAYEEPAPRKSRQRGLGAMKGRVVHLREFVHLAEVGLHQTEVEIYGKRQKARWPYVNLLWGQKLYQKLRFVLMEIDGRKVILVSTDLTLDPVKVIRLRYMRYEG